MVKQAHVAYSYFMNVLFAHDTYYAPGPYDQIYAYGAFPYKLWEERFLPHFDKVTVLGRRQEFDQGSVGKLDISSGPNVEHILLDNINSPVKRIVQGPEIYKRIYDIVEDVDGVIIRGPVEFGMMAAKAAREQGKPYAVEMSGCAFDHSWYHGSLVGKAYAPVKMKRAQNMVEHAERVMYVTEKFLQSRYPTDGLANFASNVEIPSTPESVLKKRLAKIKKHDGSFHIGLIGNYGNGLKGLGVAIEALKNLDADFQFHILGKGNPQQWEDKLENAGLQTRVYFHGTLPGGAAVLEWLDKLDLYIQPSFHEGLPRALIEAMSRGLPALASDAGGSAELLPLQYIHKKGDAKKLRQDLLNFACNSSMMAEAAENNFKKAQDYTKDVLAPRRAEFWSDFKNIIAENKG